MSIKSEKRGRVVLDNVCKSYKSGSVSINASDHVSFEIEAGEFCVVVGPSGAGKTTLLNILGGMERCDSGGIEIDGRDISSLGERALTDYRRYDVGFVFQFYNLVGNLTAGENVELAAEICRDPYDAGLTLEKVGLSGRENNFPAQLSGGEQQRVAIARALAKNPALLLCDEPTGALDYMTGKSILRLLWDTSKKEGKTVIAVTHNSAVCAMADRVISIKNGRVNDIQQNSEPVPPESIEW